MQMSRWEVRTADNSVTVEGRNWLAAVGAASNQLGLRSLSMAQMVCDIQSDGTVHIRDRQTGAALLVRRLSAAPPAPPPPFLGSGAPASAISSALPAEPLPVPRAATPPLALPTPQPVAVQPMRVQAAGPAAAPGPDAPEESRSIEVVPVEPAVTAPPPMFSMPAPSNRPQPAPPPPPAPVVEATFSDGSISDGSNFDDDDEFGFSDADMAFFSAAPEPDGVPPAVQAALASGLSTITSAPDIATAAGASLDLLRAHVPAESSAVLYAHMDGQALIFLAASGPQARRVGDLSVPLGSGIAGFCYDRGATLIVQDAHRDPRHHGAVDAKTGYRTESILAAAVRDVDGMVYGCLELLNPPRPFEPWHLDAAKMVAASLAERLRM